MRSADELLSEDDGWPIVLEWIAEAERAIEVTPPNPEVARATLRSLQVTTRSILGAIAWHAGLIQIDHGWVRLLGSPDDPGVGLRGWNASTGGTPLDPPLDDALVVGLDAVGGVFAINGGRWLSDPGSMYYFAPDRLDWEPMGLGHGEFVSWALGGDLDEFYANARWDGWQTEVENLAPDTVLSVFPPLGFQGTDGALISIGDRDRRPVPAREHWTFLNDVGRQLGGSSGSVRFRVTD